MKQTLYFRLVKHPEPVFMPLIQISEDGRDWHTVDDACMILDAGNGHTLGIKLKLIQLLSELR